MERFTKELCVGNELRQFEFTRMTNVNGVKFFITTKDENNKPISFSLNQKEGKIWKLTPGSLPWLYKIEDELNNAILDTRSI